MTEIIHNQYVIGDILQLVIDNPYPNDEEFSKLLEKAKRPGGWFHKYIPIKDYPLKIIELFPGVNNRKLGTIYTLEVLNYLPAVSIHMWSTLLKRYEKENNSSNYRKTQEGFLTSDDNWKPGHWLI